ncbi:uncharacterized protein [Anabrus simplex]|uniref:uncharacterized protein n=1 Tax=Anabrus simplex TaxID=316456 RepID=UPI0034DD6E30
MDGPDDQDRETGELIFDRETGEEVLSLQPVPPPQERPRDAETGEPHMEQLTLKKKPFQIPRSALQFQPNTHLALYSPSYNTSSHTNCLERKVECVSQNVSPIVFLLPTVFLFPGWASLLLIVFELVSHTWAHKKNKLQGDSRMLYRSPLHLITSEFCAYCRSDKLMVKIGKLQDQRLLQTHRRKIAYCAYVEKMSVIT